MKCGYGWLYTIDYINIFNIKMQLLYCSHLRLIYTINVYKYKQVAQPSVKDGRHSFADWVSWP